MIIGLGDNLHTAISVARDCSMIEEGHKVIMLQATGNGDHSVSLEYTIVGEDVSCTDEIKLLTDSYNDEFHNHSINLKVLFRKWTCTLLILLIITVQNLLQSINAQN